MERLEAIRRIADKFNLKVEEIEFALAFKPRESQTKRATATKRKKKKEEAAPKPKKYLFLKEDFDLLEEKIKKVHEEVSRLGKEIGASCDETETFHDNFDYEECGRQQKMWTNRLRQLRQIKGDSKIVSKNKEKDHVGLGSIVELKINGTSSQKKIGSFLTFRDEDLSYESPIAKAIIGKKAGDTVEVKRKNLNMVIEVIKIA